MYGNGCAGFDNIFVVVYSCGVCDLVYSKFALQIVDIYGYALIGFGVTLKNRFRLNIFYNSLCYGSIICPYILNYCSNRTVPDEEHNS